jgi:hypothetical protein
MKQIKAGDTLNRSAKRRPLPRTTGVDTEAHAAEMVEFKTSRNGTAHPLVIASVGVLPRLEFGHVLCAISLAVPCSLPYPARRCEAAVLFDVLDGRLSSSVTRHKPNWMPLDGSPASIRVLCQWCLLTTATLTE